MPLNFGALFRMPNVGQFRFQTIGCKFPLDIAWLDQNKRVVDICIAVEPNSYAPEDRLPNPARFVLETNAGLLVSTGVVLGSLLPMSPG